MNEHKHLLEFQHNGVVVLIENPGDENETILWSSDNDQAIRDHIENEFLNVEDAEAILDYLIEYDILTASEAAEADIESVALENTGVGDEDEDEDEDDS